MNSLYDDISLEQSSYIYLLPISRLYIEHKQTIGDIYIYPPSYIDFEELLGSSTIDLSTITQEELSQLKESSIIAFSGSAFHEYQQQTASNEAIERGVLGKLSCIFDYLRYLYCKLSEPKKLPGRIGQIQTGDILILLLAGPGTFTSTRFIKRSSFVTSIVVGSGLRISDWNIFSEFNLLNKDLAEVGHIATHALRMYSHALEENSETGKFIQIMRLFEFIANPSGYEKFQRVKKQIISHVAMNVTEIQEISSNFKYYTSGEKQDGLRTEIIHNRVDSE